MNTKPIDETFSYLSKLIIVIPLLVIFLAVFLKISEKNTNRASLQKVYKNLQSKPKDANLSTKGLNDLTLKQSTQSALLDLKGSSVCEYVNKEASVEAYIKNKKIYATFNKGKEIESILINGDCFYNWDKNEYTGKRTCGISSFLEMLEGLQGFNLLDIKDIFAYLPQIGMDEKTKDLLNNIDFLNFCKKKNVEDKWFILPKNILFKDFELLNITLPWLRPTFPSN